MTGNASMVAAAISNAAKRKLDDGDLVKTDVKKVSSTSHKKIGVFKKIWMYLGGGERWAYVDKGEER